MSIENEINTPSEEQVTNQEQLTPTPEEQQKDQKESAETETTEEVVAETQVSPVEENTAENQIEETVQEMDKSETIEEQESPEEEAKEEKSENSEPQEQQSEVEEVSSEETTSEEASSEENSPEESTPEDMSSSNEDAIDSTEDSAVEEQKEEDSSQDSAQQEESSQEDVQQEDVPEPKTLDPELQKLADQINIVLENKETHVLEGFSAPELTRMLLFYGQEEDITSLFPKVGLIKRSFDAIKDKEEIEEEDTQAFDTALEAFNKRRSDFLQQEKVSRAHNSERKKELILKLQELVKAEDPVRMQQEVRELQDKWKLIGKALDDDEENLNKQCRQLLDEFYKQRDMHYELLDYDRRINLQEKEKLIIEAGELIPKEEERHDPTVWKLKMDQFTGIQQKWRSIGHVPRDDMDRVNNAYREAIDKFFEVREDFKKLQDKIREENAEKKEEILRHMEQFKTFTADKPKEWNDATRELRTYQEAWKQIGQAATRKNNELWSRYREICDAFFNGKSEYFKQFDDLRSENLEKKKELCEKAEALSASTDWEKSARALKQLQKDWKSIGPVPERHSNKLWNRFRGACDKFFESRRKHYETLHAEEYDNLSAKRGLIEAVKNINIEELGSIDAAIQKVKDIQAQWKGIGKVPYKEKDNIWHEFRSTIDAFFDGLSMKREEMRDMKLKATLDVIDDPDKRGRTIRSKIVRLRRKIQQGQEKVDQYSNNILFIAKGKAGDPLRNQIQKEIDKEKELIAGWRKRIKELNELMKNPPAKEEAEKDTSSSEVKKSEAAPQNTETSEVAETETASETAEETKVEAPESQVEESAEAETAEQETTEEKATKVEASESETTAKEESETETSSESEESKEK